MCAQTHASLPLCAGPVWPCGVLWRLQALHSHMCSLFPGTGKACRVKVVGTGPSGPQAIPRYGVVLPWTCTHSLGGVIVKGPLSHPPCVTSTSQAQPWGPGCCCSCSQPSPPCPPGLELAVAHPSESCSGGGAFVSALVAGSQLSASAMPFPVACAQPCGPLAQPYKFPWHRV